MENSKITAATFQVIESSINTLSKIHVAQCMSNCNKYFIFRDSGMEIYFTVFNNKISRFSHKLYEEEENFIKKFILKHTEENE